MELLDLIRYVRTPLLPLVSLYYVLLQKPHYLLLETPQPRQSLKEMEILDPSFVEEIYNKKPKGREAAAQKALEA